MKSSEAAAPSLFSSPPSCRADTRKLIMDAAERLFADEGIEGTSIRQITTAAGVNLAAVNYHFHSKNHLVVAVFARRLEPLNSERLRQLAAAEAKAEAEGRSVALEEVLEAFIRPSLEDWADGEPHEPGFICLISRLFNEMNSELKQMVREEFSPLVRRFDDAILKAVPTLTREELFWRMTFFVGALHHSLGVWARFDHHPSHQVRDITMERISGEEFIRRLVASAAAGFRVTL